MLAKPVFGQFSVNQITNMIAADDLNNLLDYYNEIWNDPSTGPFTYVTHNDTSGDNLERRFGWGQGPATFLDSANNVRTLSQTHITTGIGTEITITDINQTIAQLNAGLYHTEDDPTLAGLIPQTIDTGQRIPKSLYETVANKIESFIAEPTNKYKVDWSTFSLYELQTTNSADWQLDLEVIHKFTFNSYNEARYFFNSGGEFTLELEMQPGGSAGNHVWQQIFDQFDSIRIGAETCRVVSDAVFDVISTSGVNKGFYTGIESSGAYSTILDAGVFRYNTNSGSEYSASSAYVYVYSEYNSRRIRIQLAADEVTPGGTFNIYVKVILVEDADDNFLITQDITLSSGYVQPSTTPLTTDGNKSFMTVGSKLFDFKERVAPTITLEGAGWTEGEYGTGEELTNWSGTWLKDVKAGYFITGQQYSIRSINDNIPVTLLITGHEYKIITVGTTDFTKLGAANNTIGTTFTATDIGTGTGTAGGATSTDTDFTLIGATDSNVSTIFTATGPGTGSGSADEVRDATDDPGDVWDKTADTTDSDWFFQKPE